MPICAPIAAGTAKPIVPAPPELIQLRGLVKRVVLGRVHLMLADAGHDDGLAAGDRRQPLDHVLRLERAIGSWV